MIRAAGDGEPIFDGDGAHRLFDVAAGDYHIFEGLTVRNTDVAFYAGMKDVGGSKGLTVRRCRLEDVGIGVASLWAFRRSTRSPRCAPPRARRRTASRSTTTCSRTSARPIPPDPAPSTRRASSISG